jgi:hypothetical protein
MNTYTFERGYDVSKVAIDKVTTYLSSLEETLYVMNVEDDKSFQEFDIDLIHITDKGIVNIEIKSDTYTSGNFFFETISNATKMTDGCFMYTCADYLYYYFEKNSTLYILPMPSTRDWFIDNLYRFSEKELATKINSRILYHSYGFAVPIKTVLKEVDNVKVVCL